MVSPDAVCSTPASGPPAEAPLGGHHRLDRKDKVASRVVRPVSESFERFPDGKWHVYLPRG